jgi:hypothetical protein
MEFVLLQSLLRDTSSQKVSKNLKIKWFQVTLPKTGLVTPCTFGPLGVKIRGQIEFLIKKKHHYFLLTTLLCTNERFLCSI